MCSRVVFVYCFWFSLRTKPFMLVDTNFDLSVFFWKCCTMSSVFQTNQFSQVSSNSKHRPVFSRFKTKICNKNPTAGLVPKTNASPASVHRSAVMYEPEGRFIPDEDSSDWTVTHYWSAIVYKKLPNQQFLQRRSIKWFQFTWIKAV